MNILITFDNDYTPHAITMLTSLFENSKKHEKYKIWAVASELSDANYCNLKTITQENNACLEFINIEESSLCDLPLSEHFNRANYYRILALDMINAQKILYLDVDLIINQDISSLWEYQLNNVTLAAVDEYNTERIKTLHLKPGASYFNSGVMLINLELWQSGRVSQKVLDFIRTYPELIKFVDQCGINKIIDGEFLQLNAKYNFQSYMYANCDESYEPAIIHFTGSSKPWQMLNGHPRKDLYWHYRQKTVYKTFTCDDFNITKLLMKYMPRVIKKLIRQLIR